MTTDGRGEATDEDFDVIRQFESDLHHTNYQHLIYEFEVAPLPHSRAAFELLTQNRLPLASSTDSSIRRVGLRTKKRKSR